MNLFSKIGRQIIVTYIWKIDGKGILGTFKSKLALIIYHNQISPLILMKKLESLRLYSNFQNRAEYGPFQMLRYCHAERNILIESTSTLARQ